MNIRVEWLNGDKHEPIHTPRMKKYTHKLIRVNQNNTDKTYRNHHVNQKPKHLRNQSSLQK